MIFKRKLVKCIWRIDGGAEPCGGIDYYCDNTHINETKFDTDRKCFCLYQRLVYEHDHGPLHDSDGGVLISDEEVIVQYLPTKWYLKN